MTGPASRSIPAVALLLLAVLPPGHAVAASLPGATLPTLALDPAPAPSLWTGLSVGSEVSFVSRKGAKGMVGGAAYAGYDRQFANNIVLGVQGSAGYTPAWGGRSRIKGFDYAATDVKIGYDLGRFLPYVTAGVALEKPRLGPALGFQGAESINGLLNGPGTVNAATRVGVGVDYALTNNLTIGVGISAVQGRGLLLP